MRWRQALRVLTLLLIAGLIAVIVVIHDKDVVALTVITFVLLLFLPSKRAWIGVAGLTLLFADVLFFTGAAATSNIRHHEQLTTVAVPAAFGALCVAGVVAGFLALVRYKSSAKGGGTIPLLIVAVVVFAGAMATSAIAGTDGGAAKKSDIRLVAKNTKFSPKHLQFKAAGDKLQVDTAQVSVFVTNRDFWWHTFTIDKLDVNLRIPEGGHRRVTFKAPPGTYKFYCAVPGHTQAGMKGTLVVT
ncbi:MAG TPA: cupredoxin domain-containing protein [Acidimicrobiales bacterium]|nr:cupredoxin domain-containing protein [Acidimicrobiales bacterium]